MRTVLRGLGVAALVAAGVLVAGSASAAPAATADLTLLQSDAPSGLSPVPFSMGYTVVNHGPATVTDATLVIDYPAGIVADPTNGGFGSIGASCTDDAAAHRVTCPLVTADGPRLPAGAEIGAGIRFVRAGLACGATVSLRAEVLADVVDPTPGDHVAQLSFPSGDRGCLTGTADVAVRFGIAVTRPPTSLPTPIGVLVDNLGPETVTDGILTVALSDGLGFQPNPAGFAVSCTFDAATRVVTCPVTTPSGTSWMPGQPVGAVITVTDEGLAPGAAITLRAEIHSSLPDPHPEDNVATVSFRLGGQAVPPSGGESDGTVLPATGFGPIVLAVLATLTMAAGTSLLVIGRRQPRRR